MSKKKQWPPTIGFRLSKEHYELLIKLAAERGLTPGIAAKKTVERALERWAAQDGRRLPSQF